MENKKITVPLSCAACVGTDFDFNEDKTYIKCKTCNREYLGGYNELVAFNSAHINEAMANTKKQIVKEFKMEITKSLKAAFRGSKFLKIK